MAKPGMADKAMVKRLGAKKFASICSTKKDKGEKADEIKKALTANLCQQAVMKKAKLVIFHSEKRTTKGEWEKKADLFE